MNPNFLFTVVLLTVAGLLSSCQAPPKTPYDRPPNVLKFHAGGYNPGTGNTGGKHHH
jgi:hypothetical protein